MQHARQALLIELAMKKHKFVMILIIDHILDVYFLSGYTSCGVYHLAKQEGEEVGLTSRLTEPQPEMSSSLASFLTDSESICDPTAPRPRLRSSADSRLHAWACHSSMGRLKVLHQSIRRDVLWQLPACNRSMEIGFKHITSLSWQAISHKSTVQPPALPGMLHVQHAA